MSLAFLTFLVLASILILAAGVAAFNGFMGLAFLASLLALSQALSALLYACFEPLEWTCVK